MNITFDSRVLNEPTVSPTGREKWSAGGGGARVGEGDRRKEEEKGKRKRARRSDFRVETRRGGKPRSIRGGEGGRGGQKKGGGEKGETRACACASPQRRLMFLRNVSRSACLDGLSTLLSGHR